MKIEVEEKAIEQLLQHYRLKPVEAPVKESVEENIMSKSIDEQSEQYADDMLGEIIDKQMWIETADIYLSVANWQAQQSGLISKKQVIDLLYYEMTLANQEYLEKLDNLISKFKQL